jgi:hypothetical protein
LSQSETGAPEKSKFLHGEKHMKKRGKILRDPNTGPGLLIVEGRQYPFVLENIWRSEVPPKPGLPVDVEFDQSGQITAITAVAESQVAKEQAEIALKAAKEKGGALFGQIVAKVGLLNLVAGAVLIISWLWLTAVSLQVPFLGKIEFTFWQVLGFLNSKNVLDVMERNGHPSAGIYGFFAFVCLAGPFLHYFWKDKRAVLGGVLPLLFMVVVGFMIQNSISSAMGGDTSSPYGAMAKQAQNEIMNAISIGMGIYLSVLASLYFAGVSAKKFLVAKATQGTVITQKAA